MSVDWPRAEKVTRLLCLAVLCTVVAGLPWRRRPTGPTRSDSEQAKPAPGAQQGRGPGGQGRLASDAAALRLARLVCLVAAGAYAVTWLPLGISVADVRCVDWVITCPLLLVEMCALMGAGPTDALTLHAALLSVVMVAVGWGSPGVGRVAAGGACLCLIAACLMETKRRSRPDARWRLVAFFFAFWPFYGLVALGAALGVTSASVVGVTYNALDIITKGAFALAVALSV